MQRVIAVLLLVGVIGVFIAELPSGGNGPRGWRRTAAGWEKAEDWQRRKLRNSSVRALQPYRTSSLALPHPWVLGVGQLLASTLALAAFSASTGRREGN